MKDNGDAPEVKAQLTELSQRVRGLRAQRGMTRKDLSRGSGISERYLAQLESGEANPSIALLWRIAQAMHVEFFELLGQTRSKAPIANRALWDLLQRLAPGDQQEAYELLATHFGERDGARSGVALIGLRGAGKTTLGQQLADHYGVPFIRLGELIEDMAGMAVSELFMLGGQKAYRRLERQAVERVIEEQPRSVVESGGSLVSEQSTFNLLRSTFHTVWVRARPEEHMQRVVDQGDMRPMEGNSAAMDDLKRILVEREPFYRSADSVIDTSDRTVADCSAELIELAAPYLGARMKMASYS